MTKLQELVSIKLENNELTELEKCLINERIGLCECQCGGINNGKQNIRIYKS